MQFVRRHSDYWSAAHIHYRSANFGAQGLTLAIEASLVGEGWLGAGGLDKQRRLGIGDMSEGLEYLGVSSLLVDSIALSSIRP